jgi:UDP-glucuronate 4-epimerase
MKILVTGAAGFIGSHVAEQLLRRGDEVIGLDNLNAYYDPTLKQARLERLEEFPGFRHVRISIEDRPAMDALFAEERPERVVHLAAQAGVRHSLTHPFDYLDANITGFLTILEGCRHNGVEHLVFASTSSVYGLNTNQPFSVHRGVDHPVSLYGATKKANEAMAHSYAHLYRFPITGLRFFTVYGPWGRPDMAAFLFTGRSWRASRSTSSTTADAARLHLRRRHRRGRGPDAGPPGRPNPEWTGDAPGPRQQLGAVPDVQHRQATRWS